MQVPGPSGKGKPAYPALVRLRPLPAADVLLSSSYAFAHGFRTVNELCGGGCGRRYVGEVGFPMLLGEHDMLVCFPDERCRLVRALAGRYTHEDDLNAHVLSRHHPLAQVFVTRQQVGASDSPLPSERHQASVDQGVHALLFATDHAAQPDL